MAFWQPLPIGAAVRPSADHGRLRAAQPRSNCAYIESPIFRRPRRKAPGSQIPASYPALASHPSRNIAFSAFCRVIAEFGKSLRTAGFRAKSLSRLKGRVAGQIGTRSGEGLHEKHARTVAGYGLLCSLVVRL